MARTTLRSYLPSSQSVIGHEHQSSSSSSSNHGHLLSQESSFSQRVSTVKVKQLKRRSDLYVQFKDFSSATLDEEFDLNKEEDNFNLGDITEFEPHEQKPGTSSTIGSFLPLRRFFYFTLSKPTHWDVELLKKIDSFGKKKFVLLASLSFLLFIFGGMVYRQGGFKAAFSPFFEKDKLSTKMIQLEDAYISENVKLSPAMTEAEVEILFKKMFEKVLSQTNTDALMAEEMTKMWKEMFEFQGLLEKFSTQLQGMKKNLSKMAVELEQASYNFNNQSEDIKKVSNKIQKLETKFVTTEALAYQVKNCCMNSTQVQEHFVDFLLNLTDGDSTNPALHSFKTWMSTMFVNGHQLRKEIEIVRETLQKEQKCPPLFIETKLDDRLKAVEEKFSLELKSWIKRDVNTSIGFFNASVEEIVKRAISLYDSDKTGQTDYALESGGGSVVGTRCSKTYNEGRPSLVLFGFPFWNVLSSPRYAIQPGMYPGECWAIEGSQGYLVVELSAKIRPTGFVLEHIAKSLSPSGSVASAPKQFTVWGLMSESDSKSKLLGEYTYDIVGEPLQYFPVTIADDLTYYSFVELKILSNHGDPKYTCLYRFRVHGVKQ